MQKLEDNSRLSLEKDLHKLKDTVNAVFRKRIDAINNSNKLKDDQKKILTNIIPAVEETINYIFDHPNTWIYFGEDQNKKATTEAIEAYNLILKIANNPNTPINENEIEILKVLDQNKTYTIVSIALSILTFALLIVFSVIFMSLQSIAITSLTITTALPIIACVFLLSAVSSFYFSDAYSQDNNFHKNLLTSLPTFFGKHQKPESEKSDESEDFVPLLTTDSKSNF